MRTTIHARFMTVLGLLCLGTALTGEYVAQNQWHSLQVLSAEEAAASFGGATAGTVECIQGMGPLQAVQYCAGVGQGQACVGNTIPCTNPAYSCPYNCATTTQNALAGNQNFTRTWNPCTATRNICQRQGTGNQCYCPPPGVQVNCSVAAPNDSAGGCVTATVVLGGPL
jgi:hypothetical protein